MGNIPILKPKEVITILEKLGFQEVRQKGSHKQFRHSDGRFTTVPVHQGRDISPILLRQIIKDIHLTIEEFLIYKQSNKHIRPFIQSIVLDGTDKKVRFTVNYMPTGSARPIDIITHILKSDADESRQIKVVKTQTLLA